MKNIQNFEEALMKKLEIEGVTKTSLKSVANEIVNLKKRGLDIDWVYFLGTPRLDLSLVNGKIDPEFFRKINDFGKMRRLEIFPYGILNPECYRFKGAIGF